MNNYFASIDRTEDEEDALFGTRIHKQVKAFHKAMDLPVLEHPQEIARERLELRLNLIAEEFLELLEAAGYELDANLSLRQHCWKSPFNMVEVADALGDLDYVIEGMRLELGINGAPIAAEIQRTNMAKVGGPIREDGKRLKPPGWLPPDIRTELLKQGWVPPVEEDEGQVKP